MPLPPEIRENIESHRTEIQEHADKGAATLSRKEREKQNRLNELRRLTEIAKVAAEEAIAKDPSVPIDLITVSREFHSARLRSKVPLTGRRSDVHGIKSDGFIKTKKPDSPRGLLGRLAADFKTNVLEQPAPTTVPDHDKKSIINRGEIESTHKTRGWGLFFTVYDRARNIGAFLSEEGRIGIYDIAGPLSRLDPEKDPEKSKDDSNPVVLPLETQVYTSQIPENESGILYLDSVDGDVPETINKILIYGGDGSSYRGLDAIEFSLYSFIANNDLDK